jgi:uncharacterized protein YndB with AHSA1/START domain
MTPIDLPVTIPGAAPEQAHELPGLRAADGLRVTYVLSAPAGQVWDALTDAEKFGSWFGARLDGVLTEAAELTGQQVPTRAHPGLGRAMKLCLGTTFTLSIDQFEPNRLLAFRWRPVTDATGAAYPAATATLVSFALAEADDVTILTVTESALRDDPRLWRPRELAMLVEKFLSGARDLRPRRNPRQAHPAHLAVLPGSCHRRRGPRGDLMVDDVVACDGEYDGKRRHHQDGQSRGDRRGRDKSSDKQRRRQPRLRTSGAVTATW